MDCLRRFTTSNGTTNTHLKSSNSHHMEGPVSDVGILGFEFYFPRHYVSQEELEKFDGVGAGKYTKGLGQTEMAFCSDDEDVCSLAMSATAALMEEYQIDQSAVGFLEVGTETLIDKSKSVKSVLMDLFPENPDVEGADVKNACYGGTQALMHAVDWVYANFEAQQRLAIVVCADIAVYAPGAARCTGGAGAIAFLVGPNAPIVMERGLRTFHSRNVYDFYKPVGGESTEYAVVDGSKSIEAYLSAVDATYELFVKKSKQLTGVREMSVEDVHAILFHSPFSKLTHKALARVCYADLVKHNHVNSLVDATAMRKLSDVQPSQTFSRDFIAAIVGASQPTIAAKLEPYMEFNRRLGNMYTPSVFAQLINAVYKNQNAGEMNDKRFLIFSYGSGLIAAMFSLKFRLDTDDLRGVYARMVRSASEAHARLDARLKSTPDEFLRACQARERLIKKGSSYTPSAFSGIAQNNNDCSSCSGHESNGHAAAEADAQTVDCNGDLKQSPPDLFPGAFYLTHIDDRHRRTYARVPKKSPSP